MGTSAGERLRVLKEAKDNGTPPWDAVRRVRDLGLLEVGKEFNVAVDLKEVYGLPVRQLADIVGWLRDAVSDEELVNQLSASASHGPFSGRVRDRGDEPGDVAAEAGDGVAEADECAGGEAGG